MDIQREQLKDAVRIRVQLENLYNRFQDAGLDIEESDWYIQLCETAEYLMAKFTSYFTEEDLENQETDDWFTTIMDAIATRVAVNAMTVDEAVELILSDDTEQTEWFNKTRRFLKRL